MAYDNRASDEVLQATSSSTKTSYQKQKLKSCSRSALVQVWASTQSSTTPCTEMTVLAAAGTLRRYSSGLAAAPDEDGADTA